MKLLKISTAILLVCALGLMIFLQTEKGKEYLLKYKYKKSVQKIDAYQYDLNNENDLFFLYLLDTNFSVGHINESYFKRLKQYKVLVLNKIHSLIEGDVYQKDLYFCYLLKEFNSKDSNIEKVINKLLEKESNNSYVYFISALYYLKHKQIDKFKELLNKSDKLTEFDNFEDRFWQNFRNQLISKKLIVNDLIGYNMLINIVVNFYDYRTYQRKELSEFMKNKEIDPMIIYRLAFKCETESNLIISKMIWGAMERDALEDGCQLEKDVKSRMSNLHTLSSFHMKFYENKKLLKALYEEGEYKALKKFYEASLKP